MSVDPATPPVASSTAAPTVGVFTRRSSGLVREFSITDAVIYGVLAAGTLYSLLYAFPVPQTSLVGVNLPIGYLIAAVFFPGVFAAYAALGSAMPRMGGDYLFQSRILHPAIGFAFGFAWEVILWVTFTTTGAIVVATFGFAPLFYNLSVRLHDHGLLSIANWFNGINGIFVTALVVSVLGFLVTIRGLGFYRSIQRWLLVPLILISNILLIILLARSHASFLAHFNSFQRAAHQPTAAAITAAAAKGGWKPAGFNFGHTLLFMSISAGTCYIVFAAQGLLGETKQASNYTKLFRGFMWGGLYVAIIAFIIPTWLFTIAVGSHFSQAYAFATFAGTAASPGGATFSGIAMAMTSSPVILIILAAGFIVSGTYFAICVFLNMTRVLSAMGMDRTLPEWFSRVSQRYHAPVNAALFYLALALVFNLLYKYVESVRTPMLLGGAFTSTGVIAVTGLAAVFFSIRGGPVYENAPVRGKKLLGLPVEAVGGAAACIAYGGVTIANLIDPALGFTTGSARLLVLASLLLAGVWYFAYRAYLRARHGINIDLAFKAVPPE
jgi:basic amino acid/polyamine antiporter, APA family